MKITDGIKNVIKDIDKVTRKDSFSIYKIMINALEAIHAYLLITITIIERKEISIPLILTLYLIDSLVMMFLCGNYMLFSIARQRQKQGTIIAVSYFATAYTFACFDFNRMCSMPQAMDPTLKLFLAIAPLLDPTEEKNDNKKIFLCSLAVIFNFLSISTGQAGIEMFSLICFAIYMFFDGYPKLKENPSDTKKIVGYLECSLGLLSIVFHCDLSVAIAVFTMIYSAEKAWNMTNREIRKDERARAKKQHRDC